MGCALVSLFSICWVVLFVINSIPLMPPTARENSYDLYPEYEMLLIEMKGRSLMTGLQSHPSLARREEIMRAKRAGARTGLQKIRIALRALKTRSRNRTKTSKTTPNR
jgi:hypothetical protein